jgi:hypothetical protein
MLAGARVLRVPRPLAKFRLHADQKSSDGAGTEAEIREIVRKTLALNPPIPRHSRARIIAQLNYDMYHLAPHPKMGFWKALLRNPAWLRAPEVREKLWRTLLARG